METIGVFGLGYVGREVISLALRRGIDVYGVDIDKSVISTLESEQPFSEASGTLVASTDSADAIPNAQYVIIAVPTPLSSSHTVDLTPLRSVCNEIADTFTPRAEPVPIVIESTIPPGTIPEVVARIFEEEGLIVEEDVFLAHAPERIDPGNEEWPLELIPRVVGGMTPAGTRVAADFYDRLLDADVYQVDSPSVAAAAKIIENAYRDINIAFVNEVALTLDQLDIDVAEALDAAATKPFGFMRFSPGAGVGGHCIPIDPYFLIEKASTNGFNNRFLKAARGINNRMPGYVAEKTIRALVRSGELPQENTALLLGKAFKSGVKDTRNSPYHDIRSTLEAYDMEIETFDPLLPQESTVESPYTESDVLVLITGHQSFRYLNFDRLADIGIKIFVDGRNVYEPDTVETAGIQYVGVGR